MKVKEFIDWIRPLTAIDLEKDLKIFLSSDECDPDEFFLSHIVLDDVISIWLKQD